MSRRSKVDVSVSSADSYWEYQSCVSFVEASDDDEETVLGSDDETYYTGAEDDGVIELDPQVVARFEEMRLKAQVLQDILQYGFLRPTEFQQRALVACCKGKDVIAHAEAGSGKKVACAIAVLQRVRASQNHTCQALILVPDNKIVAELSNVIVGMGKGRQIGVTTFFGGKRKNLEKKLHVGTHIAIGGAEFIYDAIKRGCFKTNALKMLVLYDSTNLLDGQGPNACVQHLEAHQSSHTTRDLVPFQVISFSRTLPAEIRKRLSAFMHHPLRIFMQKEDLGFSSVRQFYLVEKMEIRKMISVCCLAAAAKEIKETQTVVFCNTRGEVEKLQTVMQEKVPVLAVAGLHGGMKVDRQQAVIDQFTDGSIDTLLATDQLAQTIGMQPVRFIINYDMPKTSPSYIQRVGRKNRLDDSSVIINLVSSADDGHLKEIQNFYKIKISQMPVSVFSLL